MSVFFFKKSAPHRCDDCTTLFRKYKEIENGGFIFFSKGNSQIQITTDAQVQFYDIDEETLEPTLDHILFNFIGCNSMMFSAMNMHCVTYKSG